MNRSSILILVALMAFACTSQQQPGEEPAEATRAPNLIIILADDLGYGDICAYSCKGAQTPHIDSLARTGVRFTQAYVSAPICSPSRAGLMTGRYQQRFGHEFNAGGAARAQRLGLGTPTSETMLPSLLRDAGYATGMVGKWHLGPQEHQHPMARGFDEFFGFLHGRNLYLESLEGPGVHFWPPADYGDKRLEINPILRGREPIQEPEYLTDALTREALDFIDRHQSEPFFLYLPYNAPHTPLQVTDEYYDRFPHIADERKRIFAAMVSAVDDGVGAILEKLQQTGLEEHTLVVFLSDNGCATYDRSCYNDPLLGSKLTPFEGGTRVPFLATWKGHIEAGRVIDVPVSALDLLPTATAMAGTSSPEDRPTDGVSLLPLLHGEVDSFERPLFWRNGTNWAVVQDPWKLVNLNGRYEFLFDLSVDLAESNDLSSERPEKVEELTLLYEEWAAGTVEPLWEEVRKVYMNLQDLLDRVERQQEEGPGTIELFI